MSRYIDADALIVNMRGAFIDHIEEFRAITIIKDAPSIDIVRCKECKHYDTDVWTTRCWCGRVSSIGNCKYVKPDDFCSYGERREP